jgi:hypothetical protein
MVVKYFRQFISQHKLVWLTIGQVFLLVDHIPIALKKVMLLYGHGEIVMELLVMELT